MYFQASSAIIIRNILIFFFFVFSNIGSAKSIENNEYIEHKFPGLKIFYKDSINDAIDLKKHLEKCKWDSSSFYEILHKIKKQEEKSEEFIKITAHRASEKIYHLQATYDIDHFWVDLDDLEIFPNPIKNSGVFSPVPHHPTWAEYLCSALGHELAEHWSMMQNSAMANSEGKEFDRDEDREISHCNVANEFGDRITKDYFGSNRVRGENYSGEHLDHIDVVIEIHPNRAIILHESPDRVEFSEDSSDFQFQPRRRLAYISYEEEFIAPDYKKRTIPECN